MKTILLLVLLVSCSSKPQKTYTESMPSEKVVELMVSVKSEMESHPGFNRIKKRFGFAKIYVANIQVKTSKSLPSAHLTQEIQNTMPRDFEYVPERIRSVINENASYDVDGMVDEETLNLINKKSAPDVVIYGYITDGDSEQGSVYYLHLFAMGLS